jgi:hypothetical protein
MEKKESGTLVTAEKEVDPVIGPPFLQSGD